MAFSKLNDAALCFYRILLDNKSETFLNKRTSIVFLEKLAKINYKLLVEPLKNLIDNGIVTLSNEELSDAYVSAYRNQRKAFEQLTYRKTLAALGVVEDLKETKSFYEDLDKYYADIDCDLPPKISMELYKNKKARVKIDDNIFKLAKRKEVNILYFFTFEMSIDIPKLKILFDEYLDGFIKNKFNDGNKYAYQKQARDITLAMKTLVDAGYPKEALTVDAAQIFPKGTFDTRPTDGKQIETIWRYDFASTIFAMEREGFLKVLGIHFQNDTWKPVYTPDTIWTDPIKIKICFEDNYKEQLVKYLLPQEHEDLNKLIKEHTERKKELAEAEEKSKIKTLVYNLNTGDGNFDGKDFRLTEDTDYRKIFDACFAIRGEKLTRQRVEEILGFGGSKDKKQVDVGAVIAAFEDGSKRKKSVIEVEITTTINEAVKTLRTKTGLDTKELANNRGNITLTV